MTQTPTLQDVELFVRSFSGLRSEQVVVPSAHLAADLGITGDDGVELLQAASKHFNVQLADSVHGYRPTFRLGENELLFHSEGVDPLGIGPPMRWQIKEPRAEVRDVSIQELHEAILCSKATESPPNSLLGRTIDGYSARLESRRSCRSPAAR